MKQEKSVQILTVTLGFYLIPIQIKGSAKIIIYLLHLISGLY